MKKAFTPMKKKSVKGVMDGMPLTTEGVCQVCIILLGRQIVRYKYDIVMYNCYLDLFRYMYVCTDMRYK